MNVAKTDKILVFIGPSGVGKSSLVRHLVDHEIIAVTPSWTTRPRRDDEKEHDVEHVFCDEADFASKVSAGFFLETVTPFGLPFHYGMPKVIKPQPNVVPAIMLRAPLLGLLEKHYSHPIIYQIEASKQRTTNALMARQADSTQHGSRLQDYEKELDIGRQYANRIFINDNFEHTITTLKKAIAEDFS